MKQSTKLGLWARSGGLALAMTLGVMLSLTGPAAFGDACVVQPQCDLAINKACAIPQPPPTGNFDCSAAKPLDSISMIWNGAAPVDIKAWKGPVGTTTLLATIANIQPGQQVTVDGYAGSPNDVFWQVYQAGTNFTVPYQQGVSAFHLSCSDDDMDGPEDCGKLEGNNKTNTTAYINDWIFDGMGGNGLTLQCTPPNPPPPTESACDFTSTPPPNCLGKLQKLTLQYLGGGCVISNTQGGKAFCSAASGVAGSPVRIRITDTGSGVYYDSGQANINIGDRITAASANAGQSTFAANSNIFVYNSSGAVVQTITFHTSCSQTLDLGDRYGSLKVVGMTTTEGGDASMGTDVRYYYTVTNNTGETFTGNIVDNRLGTIAANITIPAGQTYQTDKSTYIEPGASNSVTNLMTVTGALASGTQCINEEWATVTRSQSACAAPNGVSTIQADFNGDKIPAPRYVWFNSHLSDITIPASVPAGQTITVFFDNGSVKGGKNGFD